MSRNNYERYINDVVKRIRCNSNTRKKIKEDLLNHIEIKSQETGETDPWRLLGDPNEVAGEFRENLNLSLYNDYVYISEKKIMGIPLIHIDRRRNSIAKGIFAVGGVAIGVFAFGGISIGIISFGGFALGLLFALGGCAVSMGISLGGLAVGLYVALGACAIAKDFAIGAYAQANVALGDHAKGIVSIFKTQGHGDILIKLPTPEKEIINTIRKVYPKASELIIRIFKLFI